MSDKPLDEPIYLKASGGLKTAQAQLRHLAASVADIVDETVSEPIRVLRIPGSKNFKKEYDEPQVVMLEESPGHVYSLADFEAAIGKPAAKASGSSSTFTVPEEITEGDRHTLLYKFLRSQKARNVSLEVALAGCKALNLEKCQPPLDERLLEEYLRRVWEQEDDPEFKKHTPQEEPPHPGDTKRYPKLVVVNAADVVVRKRVALSKGRFERGHLSLLSGPAEGGKGMYIVDLAARVSTGEPFPGERDSREPQRVCIITNEDQPEDLTSRLVAAGAELSNIQFLKGPRLPRGGLTTETAVKFDDDAGQLAEECKRFGAQFLIVETLLENMGDREGRTRRNTHNSSDVRDALVPFRAVCTTQQIYGVGILHPNKSAESDVENSISGSGGFRQIGRLQGASHIYRSK